MCKCVCELTTVFFSFFFVFYLCFRFARKATAQLPVGAAGIYFIFNVPLPTHFSSEIAVDEKQRPTAINLYVSLHACKPELKPPKNERSVYHFFLLYNSCPTALDSDLRKCELLWKRLCFDSIFRRVVATVKCSGFETSCLTKLIPSEWFAPSIQYFSIEFFFGLLVLFKPVHCSRCNDCEKLSRINSTTLQFMRLNRNLFIENIWHGHAIAACIGRFLAISSRRERYYCCEQLNPYIDRENWLNWTRWKMMEMR